MVWPTINIDYKDLKSWAKVSLAGLMLIMPIYFLDIYLFSFSFYNSTPIFINILIAYVLTISSLFIVTFFMWLKIDTSKVKHELAIYYGIFYIIFILLLCTGIGFYKGWTFANFFKWNVILIIGLYALSWVIGIIREIRNRV